MDFNLTSSHLLYSLPEEGISLVEVLEQHWVADEGCQELGEAFPLQREADERAGITDLRLKT